ncbi:hypothetical protein FH972_023362 [Carpinus fangiana]|uniref:UBR-type domain-containing protein n=1 Tax=Carpinus fangiana TaxID=176857 RepID=A0A5N6KVL2_9ROSI|nr:hypothetical protein FH972_023362 [Carpinus fangiana]
MAANTNGNAPNGNAINHATINRSNSISQASESSQTAQEYIRSQLQLEQDAREALPYQFDTCTKTLGPLRQTLFSCLTCNPPSADAGAPYQPAGVCYSCSISCHGEHELVELFARRDFECDCGTTRLPSTSPCCLRINGETGLKGGVHSEQPTPTNKYNQNYKNRFCGCGDTYDATTERGTMFQCLGLAAEEDGGCGEDWWHPECLLGLPRDLAPRTKATGNSIPEQSDLLSSTEEAAVTADKPTPTNKDGVTNENGGSDEAEPEPEPEDLPLPPGFPDEDSFEHLICFKCADAVSWIKAYAGRPGFLPAVLHATTSGPEVAAKQEDINPVAVAIAEAADDDSTNATSRKRKIDETGGADDEPAPPPKRLNSADGNDTEATNSAGTDPAKCSYPELPPSASFKASLFLEDDFRDHLCRCPTHFPLLKTLPFLLEEEETYEPPVSEGSDAVGADGTRSEGSRSLYDRGEAALSAVDRVRAIEGVMAYNHLRDKVKGFLKPFAESGKPVGAEDVKAYFEKLRGDDLQALREGRQATAASDEKDGGDDKGDNRKEQGGY